MDRIQKRKFRKLISRRNRIKKFGGLKHGYSGLEIDLYVWKLLDLLRK